MTLVDLALPESYIGHSSLDDTGIWGLSCRIRASFTSVKIEEIVQEGPQIDMARILKCNISSKA